MWARQSAEASNFQTSSHAAEASLEILGHLIGRDLAEVGDDPVGAVLAQRVSFPHMVNSKHQAKAAVAPGLYTGDGVFDHHGAEGITPAQQFEALQENVGLGLAGQMQTLADDSVNNRLEDIQELHPLENRYGILAGRCQPDAHVAAAQFPNEAHSRLVDIHTHLGRFAQKKLILAIGQAADGFALRRIRGRTIRNVNTPSFKEGAYAVIAGSPIHVGAIVGIGVECMERFPEALLTRTQVLIKEFLPGGGMHTRSEGNHPVKIEDGSFGEMVCRGHGSGMAVE
jgi:hypothetical protein